MKLTNTKYGETDQQKENLIMKMGKVQIDTNFYHTSNVRYLVDFVNEKMVTDIKIKSFKQNSVSDYYTSYVTVETLHMGYGKGEMHFIIHDLKEHNCNLLHEYISEFLKPDTSKYCSTCRTLLNENYECEDCIENE